MWKSTPLHEVGVFFFFHTSYFDVILLHLKTKLNLKTEYYAIWTWSRT